MSKRPKAVQFVLSDPDAPAEARPLQVVLLGALMEYHESEAREAVKVADDMRPDAEVGTKVRLGGEKGARIAQGNRPALSPAQLDAAVEQVHEEHPEWSWTRACDHVADEYSELVQALRSDGARHTISGRTVRRRTSVRW